jgi:aldose 1-epimerase
LGFHPYFACPDAPGSPVDEMILQVHAEKFWVLEKAIPTGEVLDLPEPLNFRKPKPIGSVSLDHIYTSLSRSGSLWEIAALGRKNGPGVVRIFADGNFHHVVLFIPPHRRAVAIEPYTCTADAPNLLERGIDSGWREAPPNSYHSLEVEYTWNPDDRLGEF